MSPSSTPKSEPAAAVPRPAALVYPGVPAAAATARVALHDRAARTARMVRTWAACWGLAVAAVFVPVLHFVLVPALLVAGPVLGLQKLGEAATVLSAEGPCPACGAAQSFELGRPWKPRTSVRCEGCGRALALELPGAPPAA